jgi:hypothetical protein
MISTLTAIINMMTLTKMVCAPRELPTVGGVATAANKLAIIATYLALAGLIIAVSTI